MASLPRAIVAVFRGELNRRVPATLLIAIGAFILTVTDSLNKFGSTELYELAHQLFSVYGKYAAKTDGIRKIPVMVLTPAA